MANYVSSDKNLMEMRIVDIDRPINTISGYIFSGSGVFDAIQFDLNPSTPSTSGLLRWNNTDGTLDLGLPNNITLQVGQEMFIKVINKTGSTISNGSVVYFNGRQGNRPTIALAKGDTNITSDVMGMTTQDILDNEEGYITTMGYVRQIKTNYAGWNEGDILYVSKTIAGEVTNVEPSSPHHCDIIGSVGIVGGPGIGSILVNINKHRTLEELSDINGTPLTTSGQFPIWNQASGYFDFNKNIDGFYPNTGFTNSENIAIYYNTIDRTISLSGAFQVYYHGDIVPSISGGYISPVHPVSPTSTQYLSYTPSSGVYWSSTPWNFDRVQIAMVNFDASGLLYAQRETHGMMPWETHEELHNTVGTYKQSGGTLSDYTIGSTTHRRPSISSTVIHDEDLKSTLNAWPSGLYTRFNLIGAASGVITTAQTDIVAVSGNQPYFNEFTGSIWQQTLMSTALYTCVWVVAIPTTVDIFSQARRFLFVQGQSQGTLENQQGLSTSSLNLNGLSSSELVFINKIIIRYLGGNWSIVQVDNLTGSKLTQVSSPNGIYLSTVTTDSTLSGLGTVSTPLSISGSLATVNTNLVNASGLFIKRDASLPMQNPWNMHSGLYTINVRYTCDGFGSKRLWLANANLIFKSNEDAQVRLHSPRAILYGGPQNYPWITSIGIDWADADVTVEDTYLNIGIDSTGQIYDSEGITYNNNTGIRIRAANNNDSFSFYSGVFSVLGSVIGQSGNSVQWNSAYSWGDWHTPLSNASGLFLKKDGSTQLTAPWYTGTSDIKTSGQFTAVAIISSGSVFSNFIQKRLNTTQSMTRLMMVDGDNSPLGMLDCGIGSYKNTFSNSFVPADNAISLYTYKSTPIYFGTSNRVRMVIDAGGSTGIGMDVGISKSWLSIADGGANGTSMVLLGGDNNSGSNNKSQIEFGFQNTDKYQHWLVTRHNSPILENNAFDFYTGDGTENGVYPTNAIHGLTINNGKLGVGTKYPTSKLHISGNINDYTSITTLIQNTNSGSNARAAIYGASDTGSYQLGIVSSTWNADTNIPPSSAYLYGSIGLCLYSSQFIKFLSGNSERMRIDTAGNILFGSGDYRPYFSRTDENTLNGAYNVNNDNGDLWINYRGYQDGFTQFRDFRVGDGKGKSIVFVDGSASSASIDGPLSVIGKVTASGVIIDTVKYNKQSVTVNDASADLTPTRHYVEISNSNGGTCTITLLAGSLDQGSLVSINYVAGYPYNIIINGKSGSSVNQNVEGSSLWLKTSYGWQLMGSAT